MDYRELNKVTLSILVEVPYIALLEENHGIHQDISLCIGPM